MKQFFFFSILVFSFYLAPAQDWEWAMRIGAWCSNPSHVTSDNSGDVITAMVYNCQDYGYLTRITKRSHSGQVAWTKTIGGTNQWAWAQSVKTDINNNVFILGMYNFSLSFAGTTIYATGLTNSGVFLACFDHLGNPKWLKEFPEAYNYGICLSVDNTNNLVYASYTPFSPQHWTLAKISLDGLVLWTLDILSGTNVTGVDCDADNNIYVSGQFGNDLVIDNVNYYSDTIYYNKAFIAKFNPYGHLENVEIIPGAQLNEMIIDASDNIYITGDYYQAGMKVRDVYIPEINPCGYDCHRFFIAKLNPGNTCSWFKEANYNAYRSCMDVSQNGDLFIAGANFSIDSIIGTASVQVYKIDSSGKVLWLRENGGPDDAYPYDITSNSATRSAYVVGSYSNYVSNYDDRFWFGDDTLPNVSYIGDIFLAKINEELILSEQTDIAEDSFMKIFPNPVSTTLAIQTNHPISQLSLFNILGEPVVSSVKPKIHSSFIIDLSSQPKGIYFLEVVSEDAREIRKIILN